jgi:hypothetical protein
MRLSTAWTCRTAALIAIMGIAHAADGDTQRQLQQREQQQMELRLKMQQQLDSAMAGPRMTQPLQGGLQSGQTLQGGLQSGQFLQVPQGLSSPRLDARRSALERDQQQRLQMLHDQQLRSGLTASDVTQMRGEIERQRGLNAGGLELQRSQSERRLDPIAGQ